MEEAGFFPAPTLYMILFRIWVRFLVALWELPELGEDMGVFW